MKNPIHKTTHDDVEDIPRTSKDKNMSRTNRNENQCAIDHGKLVPDTETKEPVHRKAKVVSMKRNKPKVYIRD